MGLPEVLFDLFPGMGAYSFLVRRLGPAQAERMILSGEGTTTTSGATGSAALRMNGAQHAQGDALTAAPPPSRGSQ